MIISDRCYIASVKFIVKLRKLELDAPPWHRGAIAYAIRRVLAETADAHARHITNAMINSDNGALPRSLSDVINAIHADVETILSKTPSSARVRGS